MEVRKRLPPPKCFLPSVLNLTASHNSSTLPSAAGTLYRENVQFSWVGLSCSLPFDVPKKSGNVREILFGLIFLKRMNWVFLFTVWVVVL